MTSDFAQRLRSEIAELEVALSHNATYRKLKALRSALKEYESAESPRRNVKTVDRRAYGTSIYRSPVRKQSPEREQAIEFAEKYLSDKKVPTPTREIFEQMVASGIELQGQYPQNNLSAILSNSDLFRSYGRRGWILVANDPPEGIEVRIGVDDKPDDDDQTEKTPWD